jgi:hypothetical protein
LSEIGLGAEVELDSSDESAGIELGPAPRAELLHVLMLPDLERVGMIQSYWGKPATRIFAELLIDCEEDRTLRAVLVGMLREADSSPLFTGAPGARAARRARRSVARKYERGCNPPSLTRV